MKQFKVILNVSKKRLAAINNKICIDSFFKVGETIDKDTLHLGENIVTDKRVIDSLVNYKTEHNLKSEIKILEPLYIK